MIIVDLICGARGRVVKVLDLRSSALGFDSYNAGLVKKALGKL